MASAEYYCTKAAEFGAMAKQEPDPNRRADLEWLASSYKRLAEQADLNKKADFVYETPPMSAQRKPTPQQQQVQQQQSKSDE
jgi:hypothetical protein